MLRIWIITIIKLKQLILKIYFTVTFIFNAYAALFKRLLYTCASSWLSQTYNIPLGQKIKTLLLSVISHHFELFEDYRYARSRSRLIKILWQKHYIINARFQVQNIYQTFWSKLLARIIHPNYVLSQIFRPKMCMWGMGCILYTMIFKKWSSFGPDPMASMGQSHEIYNICSLYPKDASYQISKELAI